MWAAGTREKGAAVAATSTQLRAQLRALVRTDTARCTWQLRCPQDPATGQEGQSVQAAHWGGRTVPDCRPRWAASFGLRLSLPIFGLSGGQFVVAVIYIGAGSG